MAEQKPIHLSAMFTGDRAKRLETLCKTDIGRLKYSAVVRIAFDYYCENNEVAKKKLNKE